MSISRHATYNIMGAVLPLGVTLVTVPLYLEVVGIERYGILTVCWVVLGYLGFLDLGLGPAVSQKIASAKDESPDTAEAVFWTAVWLSLGAGLLSAVLFYGGAALYFTLGHLASSFKGEVIEAVPLLGMVLPVAMVSSVAAGALHGRQRFLALNLISMTSATLMSVLPLLVAYFWSPTLRGLLVGALAARTIGLILQYSNCLKAVPLSKPRMPKKELIASLLKFGGWVTVSTAVAPLLVTIDRLAIGAVLGAAAVAAYSIPFSLISRMAIVPGALSSALYPRFAAGTDVERKQLMTLALSTIAVVMTPICILILALIEPFFTFWVGSELAAVSSPVAYFLIVGAWANGLAFVPYSLLQGSGRPDIVSKIHLAEIAPYWGVLTVGLLVGGLPGAAAAWTCRTTADCGLLFWRSGIDFGRLRPLIVPFLLVLSAALFAAFLPYPARYVALAACVMTATLWSFIVMPDPIRNVLRRGISFVLSRGKLAATRGD